MKDLNSIVPGTSAPSLFQIAAFFEEFFPPGGLGRSASRDECQPPTAEHMWNPEKLKSLLQTHKTEGASATPPAGGGVACSKPGHPMAKNSSGPNMIPGSGKSGDSGETSRKSQNRCKNVEFILTSPAARSVKLAGDFTEWENHALEMRRTKEGVWYTVVQLVPGSYSYRFIVDGQWCDDPSREHVPNPYGSENAMVRVT
jgi:hypothetical protein